MSSKAEIRYFSITPKIVQAGTVARIRIIPLFEHVRLKSATNYEIHYTPMEDIGGFRSFETRQEIKWQQIDGSIEVIQQFDGEQEHSILVEEVTPDARVRIGDFRIYSIVKDLFERRPFKGDLHIHSNRSDGRESPGYVAASCRRIGLDFMALTDHEQYEPSIESQHAFEDLDIDLRIFRGEEVHPPDNPIHIVNFGGSESINRMFSEPSYRTDVQRIESSLEKVQGKLDRYFYASSIWCFDKIREHGGLGIFCHPYWIHQERYHIPGSLADRIFADQPYDAYELIGGYELGEVESNILQVLRYQEETAKGRRIPIVGVSDAHGCDSGDLFGWYYTIVFAKSLDLSDLVTSIKELNSVAVEDLPGSTARAHGPMRLAKYAQFLLREVFPDHDRLCRDEGEAMVRFLAGDESSRRAITEQKGCVSEYYRTCFRKGDAI